MNERIDLHVHVHAEMDKIMEAMREQSLHMREMFAILGEILQEQKRMALDLTGITAAVHSVSELEDKAGVAIDAILAELKAAAGDPAAVQALTDELTQHRDALAAIVASIPAPPPAP